MYQLLCGWLQIHRKQILLVPPAVDRRTPAQSILLEDQMIAELISGRTNPPHAVQTLKYASNEVGLTQ
jgi:hypothetical protein